MTKKINLKKFNPINLPKESVSKQNIISDIGWQRWQTSYAIIRRKILLEILKT